LKIPKWIRPKELLTIKYWFHLIIIAIILLGLLQLINFMMIPEWLNIQNVFIITPLIAIADIFSHSIMKIN